jgi:ferritin-like metal-binding protein YciE
MSPLATPEQLKATQVLQGPVEGRDDAAAIAQVRAEYAQEADPLGTVPPPGSVRGVLATGIAKLTSRHPETLVDKLGERLAFERSGVRLYEAFLVKCRNPAGAKTSIPVAEVEHLRDGELRHFAMLTEALEMLGADPTCQTPCADASGVMAMGLVQTLADPRTTLAQGLEALLTAELVDNASWELLIQLAEQAGQDELVTRFRAALDEEAEHLVKVRGWLASEVLGEATQGPGRRR